MPISVVCECGAKLNAPDTSAGKRVKCPKCAAVLTVPAPEADFEILDDEPAPVKKRPARVADDDEDEDRPAKRRSQRDEEEDEDERPVKRRSRRDDEDEEEDEDDRPRPKKKMKGKKAAPKSNLPLILGIGGGVLVLAVIGVVLAVVLSGKKDDIAKATDGGGSAGINQPKGPPVGWQEFTQPEFTAYFPAGNAPQDLSTIAQQGIQQQTPGTTVKMFIKEDKAKDSGCMVMVYNHPPNVIANLTTNQNAAFDELAKNFTKLQPGTKIQSQTAMATAGHDGKQYVLNSGKDISFLRVFLFNQRLYVLMAGGPNATENDPQVKTFFDSFQPK